MKIVALPVPQLDEDCTTFSLDLYDGEKVLGLNDKGEMLVEKRSDDLYKIMQPTKVEFELLPLEYEFIGVTKYIGFVSGKVLLQCL